MNYTINTNISSSKFVCSLPPAIFLSWMNTEWSPSIVQQYTVHVIVVGGWCGPADNGFCCLQWEQVFTAGSTGLYYILDTEGEGATNGGGRYSVNPSVFIECNSQLYPWCMPTLCCLGFKLSLHCNLFLHSTSLAVCVDHYSCSSLLHIPSEVV